MKRLTVLPGNWLALPWTAAMLALAHFLTRAYPTM